MEYKIDILLSAKVQITEALDYYFKINRELPGKFLEKLDSTCYYLSLNPFFQRRYKNVRSIPITDFPYLLLYTVDENTKEIKIISCFHTSQNTTKYPQQH